MGGVMSARPVTVAAWRSLNAMATETLETLDPFYSTHFLFRGHWTTASSRPLSPPLCGLVEPGVCLSPDPGSAALSCHWVDGVY